MDQDRILLLGVADAPQQVRGSPPFCRFVRTGIAPSSTESSHPCTSGRYLPAHPDRARLIGAATNRRASRCEWTRTTDLGVMSTLLYRLSYAAKISRSATGTCVMHRQLEPWLTRGAYLGREELAPYHCLFNHVAHHTAMATRCRSGRVRRTGLEPATLWVEARYSAN